MKTLKRLAAWSLLAIMIEIIVGVYVDKVYLKSSGTFKDKIVESNKEKKIANIEFSLPKGADRLNISYDGKYISYYKDDSLKVINTQNNKVNDIKISSDAKLSYYKWLPDTNRMIIAEKNEEKRCIKFLSYDANKNCADQIVDNHGNIFKIDLTDKKSEVTDLAMSSLSQVMHIKVLHSGNRHSMYTLNIMNQLEKVNTNSYLIGKIAIAPHDTRLIYEDNTYNKIVVSGTKTVNLKEIKNPRLLYVDGEDKLYIGKADKDESITKIYFGDIKTPIEKWQSVELKEKVKREDIFIMKNGKIYINNSLKGSIIDINSNTETVYEGVLIGAYNKGIVSMSEDKLIKTPFK